MATHVSGQNAEGSHDRRSCARYPFFREVNVVAHGEMFAAPTSDLSLEGARVRLVARLQPKTPLALSMSLGPPGETPQTLTVGGELVWQNGRWCGIRFVDPPRVFDTVLRRLLSQYLLCASPDEVSAFLRESARHTPH